MLPGNDMVNGKNAWIKLRRELAILTSVSRPQPNLANQFAIHLLLLRVRLQKLPRSRLHNRQQVAHVNVAVQLVAFLRRQNAILRTFFYLWISFLLSLVLLAILFRRYDEKLIRLIEARNSLVALGLHSSTEVAPAKGLLFLVSRGPEGPYATYAIDHHRSALTHLWLLHSSDQGSLQNLERIKSYSSKNAPHVEIKTHELDDMFSIEVAKANVELVRQEAHAAGLKDEDFICDFTGMTSP